MTYLEELFQENWNEAIQACIERASPLGLPGFDVIQAMEELKKLANDA